MSLGGRLGPVAWGDGEQTFRLGIGQLRDLQARCDAGPGEIASRLFQAARALEGGLSLREAVQTGMIGTWRVDDVRETILQGLIGAGMPMVEAAVLVQRNVDHPLAIGKNIALAYAIVMAAIEGVEDEPLGEAAAGKARSRSSGRKSASPRSTATAAPSGGRRARSTN